MPKSNPIRAQKKKQRRHNPISRQTAPPTLSSTDATPDVLPILTNLPLPGSSRSLSIEEADQIHRSLLGLNPLLLAKSSRSLLLSPKHKLLARLVHQLEYPRLEIRKEAAGCLRNLCVQGGWKDREQLWQMGAGAMSLAQIDYVAKRLGLRESSRATQPQPSSNAAASSAPPAGKKPEEMNRKERRQAAKAAKAAEGKNGAAATTSLPAVSQPISALSDEAIPTSATDEHEIRLLYVSLLENHLTIVWCLLETIDAPTWLSQLSSSSLGPLLCSCIAQGSAALTTTDGAAQALNKVSQKESEQVKTAQIELALTAASLLATWLEDDVVAAGSVVGAPADLMDQLRAAEEEGIRKSRTIVDVERLEALSSSSVTSRVVNTLAETVETFLAIPQMTSKLDVQRVSLALLALASCSNLLSSLPKAIRSMLPAPKVSSSVSTLTQWQLSVASPLLLKFIRAHGGDQELWKQADKAATSTISEQAQLQSESGMQVDVEANDGEAEVEEEATSLASDQLEVLTLAVETLGEICAEGDAGEGSGSGASVPDRQVQAVIDEEDEDGMDDDAEDLVDDDADSLTSSQEEEMFMLAERDRDGDDEDEDDAMDEADDSTKEPSKAAKRSKSTTTGSAYQALLSDYHLPTTLLEVLPASGASSPAAESFAQAVYSTIAALLSGLASHAQPPPSHPLEEGSRQQKQVARFQQWVTDESVQSTLTSTWNQLKQSLQTADGEPRSDISATLARSAWTSLHALVVLHEGLDALPFAVPQQELLAFFGASLDHHLAAATSTSTSTDGLGLEDLPALTSSLIISTLACLGRIGFTSANQTSLFERNRYASSIMLTLFSSISTIPLPVLLASLNSFIDLYADETAPWDQPVFIQGNLLSLFKATIPAIRSRVKAIDKRKYEDLREEAEEVYGNVVGFVEYREGLQQGQAVEG